jgi:hypothetical protein
MSFLNMVCLIVEFTPKWFEVTSPEIRHPAAAPPSQNGHASKKAAHKDTGVRHGGDQGGRRRPQAARPEMVVRPFQGCLARRA